MKKVILFTAGQTSINLAKMLLNQNKDLEILFFIDNDPSKANSVVEIQRGDSVEKFKVFQIDAIAKVDYDEIIVGSHTNGYEIKEQLENYGIPTHKINLNYMILMMEARKKALENFAQIAQDLKLEGECAELGVFRGNFAKEINKYFPNKKLYLFDTFEGFHENDKTDFEVFATDFTFTSENLVLSQMPYPKNCITKKGYFPDSLDGLEERFCFVSLDTDLYKPILAGLDYFFPRLVSGGAIFIHDYFDTTYTGVRKAVLEFSKRENVSFSPLGDGLSVCVVKN